MGCEDDDRRDEAHGLHAVALSGDTTKLNAQTVLVEEWQIPSGEWRSMQPLPGDVVAAQQGILWVTVEGDVIDHVLHPGEALSLTAGALTFFGALNREAVRFTIRRRVQSIAKACGAGRCSLTAPLSQRARPADTQRDNSTTVRHTDRESRNRPSRRTSPLNDG